MDVNQPESSAVASVLSLEDQPSVRPGLSSYRWTILGLIFLGTTINYLDRGTMGVLAPDLQKQFKISDTQYGYIQSAFAIAYAFSQLAAGGMLDKFGTRIGYAFAMAAWSISAMLHAVARGFWSFWFLRVALGVSESPAFPAATKIVAEWFPRRERAFAFGFVNAGCNVGTLLMAFLVPLLAAHFGWQWAFIGTGGLGLLFLLIWLPIYNLPHQHPSVSQSELDLIRSDPSDPPTKMPWLSLLSYPQAWAFAIAKFFTDSMWWFYITWFPKYLNTHQHLDLQHLSLPLITIYTISMIGAIGGGYISSVLIKQGATVNFARKITMLICAFAVVPVIFAQGVSGLWPTVLILGLATAGHQGFSSNLYTLVSDMFPKFAVASVAGLGGMCGYMGASIFQIIVGKSVDQWHNYTIPFVSAGTAYLLSMVIIQLLAPRLRPARIK